MQFILLLNKKELNFKEKYKIILLLIQLLKEGSVIKKLLYKY